MLDGLLWLGLAVLDLCVWVVLPVLVVAVFCLSIFPHLCAAKCANVLSSIPQSPHHTGER